VTASPIAYPHQTPPPVGQTLAVAPGLLWLRMPLPFALDHINLWLIEDGSAWTAVDTGYSLAPVRTAWQEVLADKKLSRLLVTHFHPDHLGLAAWLQERTGAPLWMTQGDYLTAQVVHAQLGSSSVAAMVAFYRSHGLSDEVARALEARGNAYARGVPAIPPTFNILYEGDEVKIGEHRWRVMIGHGHAPEHVSLYCEKLSVLISGDMLLPRISTNVSVYAATPESDPLEAFLASIDRLRILPSDTLILPSHGLPFRGLHTRIAQLEAHHAARCEDLLAATETPKNAADVLPVLFPREITDPHQAMFAMGEAIAHLNYLEKARRLERIIENGAIRFVRS
jgi:glyoxylase-like metal-dependent hydrolase (beta-lactamase superfamily II)